MNVKSKLSVLSLVLAMAGCGDDVGNWNDVLIIVPDSGRTDALVTDGFSGDQGDDRDMSVGDDTVDLDVSIPDQGGADTNVNDTVEPTDEGQDMFEDVAPRCSLGKAACNSSSADRKTCQTASVFGRTILTTDNAVAFTYNTFNMAHNDDPPNNDNADDVSTKGCPIFGDGDDLWCKSECSDSGLDHFFQVYLIPGDLFTMTVNDYAVYKEFDENIDFMLKVYRGNQCPLDRTTLVSCIDNKHSGSANAESLQIAPMTPEEEGWYTIVLDSDDEQNAGTYSLSARIFKNSEYTGDWSVCCDYPLE